MVSYLDRLLQFPTFDMRPPLSLRPPARHGDSRRVGAHVEEDRVFPHGQLYVAFSERPGAGIPIFRPVQTCSDLFRPVRAACWWRTGGTCSAQAHDFFTTASIHDVASIRATFTLIIFITLLPALWSPIIERRAPCLPAFRRWSDSLDSSALSSPVQSRRI